MRAYENSACVKAAWVYVESTAQGNQALAGMENRQMTSKQIAVNLIRQYGSREAAAEVVMAPARAGRAMTASHMRQVNGVLKALWA